MKTGLESLDTGAPEITYSGNQGPKSPQEDQRMMQEFEMQQMVGGENDRVRELLLKQETKGLSENEKEELRQLIKTISAGMEGGIGDMAMKSGLIDEYRNYKMGQEDAGQPVMSPRDYYRSQEQDRMGAAGGGLMGSNAGSMLVAPTKDGSRPGYYGPDEGHAGEMGSKGFGSDYSGGSLGGGGEGISDAGARRALADSRNTLQQSIDRAASIKAEQQKAAQKEQERIQNIIESQKGKTPEAYSSTKFGKAITPYDFGKRQPGVLSLGLIPTAVNIAKKIETKLANDRIRKELGLEDVDEIEMDMPNAPFGRSRVRDTGGGDGPPIILPPVMPTTGMAVGEDVDIADTDTEDFVSRFGRPSSLPFADYRGGIEVPAADGGRIGYAGGGITDLRQGYFLGKLVKKATRAVKKIVKSPIGKAALLAVGANYAPLLFGKGTALSQMKAAGGLGKFLMGAKGVGMDGGTPGLLKSLGLTKGGFGSLGGLTKRGIFGGITALSSLPLFMGQEEDEDDLDKITGQAARGPSIQDVFGMNLNQIAKGAREGTLDPNTFNFLQSAADGGRIGLAAGGIGDLRGALSKEMFGYDDDEDDVKKLALGGSAGLPPVTMQPSGQDAQSFGDDESTGIAQATPTTTLPNQMPRPMMDPRMMQQMMMQQRMNPMMARGMMQQPRIMAQEGGMMDMGGMEKDYRNEGGFVPIGGQERADDVPARLSKNEFVFTADAVRNAGGGDIDKGAEIMENMMENLEAGGKVSKGSQGLSGAREMFATQQRLGEVL